MSFSYRPAVLDKTSVLIGLAGPTGCGKTYSALRLARGLVGKNGRIGFVDTEAGRGLHYARFFDFHHGILTPPFDPAAFIDAVEAYDKAGFDAIIIDSMTHEYSGEGGLQEWADRLETGIPKDGIEFPDQWNRDHWIKQPVKSPGNWNEPKTEHKRMLNRFLQCRAHLIFCFRAEEKIKIEKVNNKAVIIPVGWKPITEKNFMYEMTASFMLSDITAGVPKPIKLQDQHKDAFPENEVISENTGAILAAWANSGAQKLESKARTLPLTTGEGKVRVLPTAQEWLAALDAELKMARSALPVFEMLWQNNSDIFYKIERAAAGRKDQALLDIVNAIGVFALSTVMPKEIGAE